MEDLMIKIDNVKKQYRLGAIGGGTLQGDLQTWWAKVRGKEDPNSIIGAKVYKKNEKFMALDGVSFEVKKGERVGIIGHNGAGKSTLLKLLSRVTAPTEGQICLNGRVASMLEVGTGFHGELTGRENIYMNGAILGMTKAEIDAKMEDIIEFSECRQFIDTPVKRYSSGMYVKLAFSVAAHLDSEIMIMDEVLAVGDMAFQKKCLQKMSQVSETEGRTVLYVSHNMNTIRQLCDRVVVLDHGKVVFDGDVEEGINIYVNSERIELCKEKSLVEAKRYISVQSDRQASFQKIKFLNQNGNQIEYGNDLKIELTVNAKKYIKSASIRFTFISTMGYAVGSSMCIDFDELTVGENILCFTIPTSNLVGDLYYVNLTLLEINENGSSSEIDIISKALNVIVKADASFMWSPSIWGAIRLTDAAYEKIGDK